MLRFISIIPMVFIALFVGACGPEEPEQHRFMLVIFDLTPSMNPAQFEEAKAFVAEKVIPNLQEGDKFGIMTITPSSYEERVNIVMLPVSQHYLDPKNDSVVVQIKRQLQGQVRALRIRKDYTRTDEFGAIAAASDYFAEDTAANKKLYLFSDLENNVDRSNIMEHVSLKGVRVYALFVSHKFGDIKDDYLAFKAKQQYWQNFFHKAGSLNTFIWDANLSSMKLNWLAQ